MIRTGTLSGGTLKGVDYGASISLILDESEPGQGPRRCAEVWRIGIHDPTTNAPCMPIAA